MICLFFSCEQQHPNLPDPLEAGWKGKQICELIQDDSELRVLRCTFEPGDGHERHYHKPHFGYALSGGTFRITDTTGTREVELPTGSSFRSENGVAWHEVLNIGETTAVYLIVEAKQGRFKSSISNNNQVSSTVERKYRPH